LHQGSLESPEENHLLGFETCCEIKVEIPKQKVLKLLVDILAMSESRYVEEKVLHYFIFYPPKISWAV